MAIILGGLQDPYLKPSAVTGPFITNGSDSMKLWVRSSYRQKPRRVRPLKYDLTVYGALPGDDVGQWPNGIPQGPDFGGILAQKALERARGKFNTNIASYESEDGSRQKAGAGLGVDIVEWRQSLRMIEDRANQLRTAYVNLKRGDIKSAYSTLTRDLAGAHRQVRLQRGKPFAKVWLEWHFGWSPLISDIHEAVQVLQSPISSTKVRARASVSDSSYQRGRFDNVVKSWSTVEIKYRVELGAEIYVSNPNLRLASQLGLINPVALAWEVVPFSFLVDWIVPVGGFLSQWSDFVGLKLEGAYTTWTAYLTYRGEYHTSDDVRHDHDYRYRYAFLRDLGISNYRLTANRFTGLSAARAATAVSLLLQSLRS